MLTSKGTGKSDASSGWGVTAGINIDEIWEPSIRLNDTSLIESSIGRVAGISRTVVSSMNEINSERERFIA